ncbi:hypothetical protein COCC4DRAFT_151032 [Bipolaris maydis ATCC 48331]|uniref:Uncharacterized protein n=2 Tax=Cochliobolus heterostrophus TaxID=5016 RepID=M2T676_COCH5|nr:uncharacterized protein COCC4DRAFT_151032 [Bipolaris maydis ATCC 48331]EMD93100.1 hypothetical protein COCHEDRAFT_1212877 [Bipolaris maydis C5]KAJ5020281.1 hypothetical protein J3E73DRAFT_377080 [Bipolaris maydis]ENI00306.1 hypothetical protein COCC4DRAFT_151032 [Bipolaris maydis ATCC 48331]KAJ5025854.1 hypothetical protein J3E73DRAFT_370157 [Bipolaris maydis]KAJ6270066.1 hypothetical protein PSV08DRAFT_352007 [Bipolaris maydis]
MGLALTIYASPEPAVENLKRQYARTACVQNYRNDAPQGYCQTYNGDGLALGDGQACRKSNPCKVEGNGCILNIENYEGGWYANCS